MWNILLKEKDMKHTEVQVKSEEIFKGRVVHLIKDEVELENGKHTTREVIRHPGGVCVAALDEDLNLLLVKQFRYPLAKELLELPAGKLEYGEEPLECGTRELEEETGYTSERLSLLGKLYPTPAYTDEVIYIYYTMELIEKKQKLDDGEFLTVIKMPFWDVYKRVMDGEILDSKTQIAVLKLGAILKDDIHGK